MLITIGRSTKEMYTVTINADNNSYQLSKTTLIVPKAQFITKYGDSYATFSGSILCDGNEAAFGASLSSSRKSSSPVKVILHRQTIVDQMQNYVLGGIIGGVIYNTDIGTVAVCQRAADLDVNRFQH